MRFEARVESLRGALPHVTYRWDAETEILAGTTPDAAGGRGFTGTVELEDAGGSIVALDLKDGDLRGVEVVVWPPTDTVDELTPPKPAREGRLAVPARPSQPGIGLLEANVILAARRRADDAVIHLRLGAERAADVVAVADNLLLELDGQGELVGLWLVGVPPFPGSEP